MAIRSKYCKNSMILIQILRNKFLNLSEIRELNKILIIKKPIWVLQILFVIIIFFLLYNFYSKKLNLLEIYDE